ncbi:MAG: sterol desaturase/sphingolipid hydroxylase (fatty acid hydroxylase superfamily) [Saprospiraceae bacterium]
MGFNQPIVASLVSVFDSRVQGREKYKTMNYIDQQFEAFASSFYVMELIGLAFLVLILAETAWDLYTKKRPSYGESAGNILMAVGNHFLERTTYGLVFILGVFIAQSFAFASIPHAWWSWVLAILVADLTYYWMHRLEHEIRILWAYHSVHHSSPEFNLTTSLRLAWIEGAIEWLFFVPMVLMGFSAIQTIIGISIVVLYQTWIHTERVGKLGWADRIFNTPSVHRVHHGSNKQYHDKNYGGILILWDRLFGTYKTEEEKVIYGITTPVGTWNPIALNVHEFWQIAKDVRNAKSIGDAFSHVFKSPGWKPETQIDNQSQSSGRKNR